MSELPSSQPRSSVTKSRRWPWVSAVVVALVLGIGIGGAAAQPDPEVVTKVVTEEVEPADLSAQRASADKRDEELSASATRLDEREAKLDKRESKVMKREKAVSAVEQEVEANTFADGVWTVGSDIKPGTYQARDVSSDCYWAITRTGSNGSDIIQNDIPGGGNPQVTLSQGQDFTSQRCGEWTLK